MRATAFLPSQSEGRGIMRSMVEGPSRRRGQTFRFAPGPSTAFGGPPPLPKQGGFEGVSPC